MKIKNWYSGFCLVKINELLSSWVHCVCAFADWLCLLVFHVGGWSITRPLLSSRQCPRTRGACGLLAFPSLSLRIPLCLSSSCPSFRKWWKPSTLYHPLVRKCFPSLTHNVNVPWYLKYLLLCFFFFLFNLLSFIVSHFCYYSGELICRNIALCSKGGHTTYLGKVALGWFCSVVWTWQSLCMCVSLKSIQPLRDWHY